MIRLNILKQSLFFLILLYPGNFYSQIILTLEQCSQIAIDNNLEIRKQKFVIKRSEKNYKQSYFELTPNIYGSAAAGLNSGRTLNTETYSYIDRKYYDGSLGIGADVIIFNGLKQINSVRKNSYDLKSNIENLEKVKKDIRLSVANFYYQVLLYQELVKSSQQQLEITLSLEDKLRITFGLGRSSKTDLLEVLAQKYVEKQEVESNKNNLDLSYFLLKQILNDDSITDIRIAELNIDLLPDTSILSQNADSLQTVAINCMPQMSGIRYQLKASQTDLSVSRGNRSPKLILSGVYNSRYSELASNPRNNGETLSYPFTDQIRDKVFAQVYLTLSFPIYNKNRINNSISLAKIAVEESKVETERIKKQLYEGMQRSRFDAIEAYNKYLSQRELLTYNEEIFKSGEDKYSKGLISSLEFKIAKNNYLNAQSGMLKAKYQYLYAIKNLNYYMCK